MLSSQAVTLWKRVGGWLAKRAIPALDHDPERRAALRATPLSEAQHRVLERFFAPYRGLARAERVRLVGELQVFAGEKEFVGDGLEIDDRVRLVVAASAALLVLGHDISVFDHVIKVRVRRDPFDEELGAGRELAGRYRAATHPLLGRTGEVELIWRAVVAGLARSEGEHVVLHELAHAFDHGLDLLQAHPERARWEAALHELPLHTVETDTARLTQLVSDVTGAELFAVATELFFEVPHRLAGLAPSLFEELRAIYNLDPRTFAARP